MHIFCETFFSGNAALSLVLFPESFINFTRAHPNGSITSHYVNYIINIFTRFSLKKFYVDVDFMCPVLYVLKEFRQTIQNGKEMYIYASPLWNWAIEFQIMWWYFLHYEIEEFGCNIHNSNILYGTGNVQTTHFNFMPWMLFYA